MHIEHFDALIVGAGWAGIWLLHSLRQKGLKCLCVEAHDDVGGVWLYTKYPGCRNETETPVYQFSAKETWESWNWTERFPTQQEIHLYVRHISHTLKLYDDMMFNTRISRAAWNETEQHWMIFDAHGLLATSQFFILCTGYTGHKYIPSFKGLETFAHAYHTSEWPSDLSVTDKRVGVIGTGSSGIQTIETIGSSVKQLTVFQRTPNLANPRRQEVINPVFESDRQGFYPQRYSKMKATRTGLEFDPIDRDTFEDTSEQRNATYESLWDRGAQHFWFGNYRDLLTNRIANLAAYDFWRSKVAPRIHCPVKRAMLAPRNPPHAFGTKRPSLESSYFEVYNQPNVDLVDLKTDFILEITPKGVQMASGAFYELDILVLATGYDFGIGSQLAIEICGTQQITLREKWGITSWPNKGQNSSTNGVLTYLGMMSAGFPNMMFSCGAQAPTGLSITPRIAELQGEWMADCIAYVRQHGRTIEPTVRAELEWKVILRLIADGTLIAETDGWYMSNNISGRKKEPLFWFGGIPQYMSQCNQSAKNNYQGFVVR